MFSAAFTLFRLSAPVRTLVKGNNEVIIRVLGGSISGKWATPHGNTFHSSETVGVIPSRMFMSTVKPADAVAKVDTPLEAGLPIPSEDHVRSLFKLWNDALASEDPRIVAKRYAKEAVLLPTVSDEPRMDSKGIEDYFVSFLKLKPQGDILISKVHVGPGWAQDAGIYEFTLGATNKKVKARYSFVYVYEDDQWKVLHHHSSQMPEEVISADAPKLTAEQVGNLFHLWNDALDTLDPEAVASRYTKNAVLLPTVSDIPRTTPESIKDYFTLFPSPSLKARSCRAMSNLDRNGLRMLEHMSLPCGVTTTS